ncbi:hypothetical protein COLO4_32722 [Corchorus olitorius]|uniref:Uncharacterized protein n=1 Tax=Corchorus olitorius TaxID=93759 RepID=A0A1R3GYM5_9ROSI|nr:hypothetical protein COLO4_32722 [Corchorus olitorius]
MLHERKAVAHAKRTSSSTPGDSAKQPCCCSARHLVVACRDRGAFRKQREAAREDLLPLHNGQQTSSLLLRDRAVSAACCCCNRAPTLHQHTARARPPQHPSHTSRAT